ncbi:MAG: ABC transporter ATP-binding protein [Nocardioides sp.]|uniref:ABC transporter ATP-binding protein n=1 Tax=Nocardioides sp. TaxID=35761 RepID=UPI0039E2160B
MDAEIIPTSAPTAAALEIEALTVEVGMMDRTVRLLDNVSFAIQRGKVLGLIGESGSGKTMTALSTIGLLPRGARVANGSIRLAGEELLTKSEAQMRKVRGARIGFVFQDPMTTLNPVLTIGMQIKESLRAHGISTGREADDRAAELLDMMGISNPRMRLKQYPHEFSGGMRQRIVIAMALACEPELLVADEPTTALDVTIQAQILELVHGLKDKTGVACLWITHDLGVAASLCDDLAIMYGGQVVETGSIDQVFTHPWNPYTRALIDALPRLDRDSGTRLAALPGSPPPASAGHTRCAFYERCAFRTERCGREVPRLVPRPGEGAFSRCFGTEEGGWIDEQSLTSRG